MKLYDVYPLFDINIVKGQGCKVWDDKGQEYLDLYGGHAVISIGHCHPHYVEMLTNQLNNLGFYSNSVINKLQVKLAERLGKISGYEDYQFFLINSGAEANENALKLASFTNGRTRVLSIEKAFHGRTSLAVEVTNNPKIIAPINDNGHVTYLPINDLEAWEKELAKGDVCYHHNPAPNNTETATQMALQIPACFIETLPSVGVLKVNKSTNNSTATMAKNTAYNMGEPISMAVVAAWLTNSIRHSNNKLKIVLISVGARWIAQSSNHDINAAHKKTLTNAYQLIRLIVTFSQGLAY